VPHVATALQPEVQCLCKVCAYHEQNLHYICYGADATEHSDQWSLGSLPTAARTIFLTTAGCTLVVINTAIRKLKVQLPVTARETDPISPSALMWISWKLSTCQGLHKSLSSSVIIINITSYHHVEESFFSCFVR